MARAIRVSDLSGPAASAVRRARDGERVPVTAKGRLVAEIVPPGEDFESEPPAGPVVLGSLRGKIRIAPDFDEPS